MADYKYVLVIVTPVIIIACLSITLLAIRAKNQATQSDKALVPKYVQEVISFETTLGPCNYEFYIGDGFCDDDANTIECLFDGNDCCLPKIQDEFCSKCICHADGQRHAVQLSLQETCESWDLVADGYCQDKTNNEACLYDGGDCCLDFIDNMDCLYCICNIDGTRHPEQSITCDATGDGACDDKDNIEQCNYDGGDCCLPIIATDWCIQCICHEDGTKHPDYNSEDECIASWQGDGDCDEKQNTAKCKYDHGDCCLPVIDDKYCFSCICHEDGTKHTTLEEVGCSELNITGDGLCDDSSNRLECYFDGGDCCLPTVININCAHCECKKYGYSNPNEDNSDGQVCLSILSYWVGDGNCDPENNNPGCDYDGNDCCLEKITNHFCDEGCICHLDGTKHPATCYDSEFYLKIGDGYCQDFLNIEECYYDGSDCCTNWYKPMIIYDECTECICHLDGTRHPGMYTTECTFSSNVGDGVCDDAANNEKCDYDGLDCCLDHIYDYVCNKCICHLDGTKHPSI